MDFAKLKSDLQLSEKTEFASLKAENERLMSDVERLKQRLKEEITKTKAGVRLDLSLEKGRIRDELSLRQVKLTEVDTRLENEISQLRTSMETVKFSCVPPLSLSLSPFIRWKLRILPRAAQHPAVHRRYGGVVRRSLARLPAHVRPLPVLVRPAR